MIVTVTLNPSIDKTLLVDDFAVDMVFRGEVFKNVPGGKGINVSRAVKRLGGKSVALFPAGGDTGRLIQDKLHAEGIKFETLEILQESRTCYAIIDGKNKTETVINEKGPKLCEDEIDKFKGLYENRIRRGDIVALSGSAPSGVGETIYYDLVKITNNKGAKVILDTSGTPLKRAVDALPFFLKVNRKEMETLLEGHPFSKENIKPLLQKGIETIIVTQGRNTLLAFRSDKIIAVAPPVVQPINTWGSGDCVVAGLSLSLERGDPFEEALRYGVAAGTANTLSFGAGFINRNDVAALYKKVDMNYLE